MDSELSKQAGVAPRAAWQIATGLALFACFYAVINRFQLVTGVLYRAAADDMANAAANFGLMAIQGALVLAATVLLPRRWFIGLMVLVFISVIPNLGFGQTTGAPLEAGDLAWLIAEARQAGHAAGEFAGPFALVAVQLVVAAGLWLAARRWLARPMNLPSLTLIIALIIPGFLISFPQGSERNLYTHLIAVISAEPPPPRAEVTWEPQVDDAPQHIVWVVDESIAYEPFRRLILPALTAYEPVDFGVAASMGHCSAPANVALRSGVDVRRANQLLDLRTTPSIWGYARKAGYRTVMLDGQIEGRPQNLLRKPELALIDDYRSAAGDMDADDRIAEMLNAQIRGDSKTFTLALLRGVHFQYRDHYPAGSVPKRANKLQEYEAALKHSKGDFFTRLLDGVDRSKVAIAYLSDHGQNLSEGILAHCSADPVQDEFRIPLIAFLPDTLRARYSGNVAGGRSASQLLPATLGWMGYDHASAERRYDNDLDQPTARYVWFGRNVIPLKTGDAIEINTGDSFPGKVQ